ncbi:endosomal t-SNARE [Testicularia cyperi]|uniref:Endosomal t-SNARE n=1 Tax=Testicularia cyperi TaxID=1882483 RepID=A0A317XZ47_9BASI|nr:endosomal t-SNARE [Testicularia cyperi]
MAQAQPLQSISIPRYETRSSSTSTYVVFAVVIQLPVRSWTVYRRYSEFVRLDKNLAAGASGGASGAEPSGAGRPAPKPLPPKDRAREWKKTFSGFLSFAGGESTSASNADQDEQAWLRERKDALEQYLKAIVMDEEPAWRESEAFKAFIEWPMSVKMVTAGHAPATSSIATGRRGAALQSSTASTSARTNMPGSYSDPKSGSTRTLGTQAPRKPAEETDFTRPLDNTQLFQSQTDAMDQQDQQLLNLTAVLRRQRQMGEAINQELAEQTELLGQLDTEVESTQSKLAHADAKMDRFDGGKARRKLGVGRKF